MSILCIKYGWDVVFVSLDSLFCQFDEIEGRICRLVIHVKLEHPRQKCIHSFNKKVPEVHSQIMCIKTRSELTRRMFKTKWNAQYIMDYYTKVTKLCAIKNNHQLSICETFISGRCAQWMCRKLGTIQYGWYHRNNEIDVRIKML